MGQHLAALQMPNWSREVLQDVLSDALSQAWTPAQEAILSSEAGMESVIDAVGRVNAAAQVPRCSVAHQGSCCLLKDCVVRSSEASAPGRMSDCAV